MRTTSDKAQDGTSPPDQMATYELGRLKYIADNPSTSVFTCQHSLLSENVVVKVARYKGKSADSLISCATTWQREKTYLESLRHVRDSIPLLTFPNGRRCLEAFVLTAGKPNIISFKAFDGRLFAIYIEHLPSSLYHGINSSFGPVEGRAILRDISSALAYLAEKEIAHNDIKPANIAYSPQRGPVLLDFGVATSTKNSLHYAGTPWYVPPDIFRPGTRGAPADVWALGVTILYVLGKIQLPEKTAESWIIHEVKDQNGVARKRMQAWVDSVMVTREKLDRSNSMESLVYQMLELRVRSRIEASQIVTSLDSAGRALVGS